MSNWWFIDLWKWFHPNASFERENRLVIFTLFATQGVVLIFGNGSIRSIAKGDFCGEELLAWKFESASYSNPPLSTTYVKSQTKEIIMHSQIICLRHTTRWEFDLHFQQQIMTKQPILTPPLVLCGLIKPRKIQALSNYNYLAKLKLSIIIFVKQAFNWSCNCMWFLTGASGANTISAWQIITYIFLILWCKYMI